jgi:predicted HAD superfamily Cof-like phosphohydrolase
MSLVSDIAEMHKKFGVNEIIYSLPPEKLAAFLEFRKRFIAEEFDELSNAIAIGNNEEIVDACIDIVVVALGTLDAVGVDVQKAWDEVHRANMAKEPGIKEGRFNPLGLPDLVKPKNWQPPSHQGNHGILTKAFTNG